MLKISFGIPPEKPKPILKKRNYNPEIHFKPYDTFAYLEVDDSDVHIKSFRHQPPVAIEEQKNVKEVERQCPNNKEFFEQGIVTKASGPISNRKLREILENIETFDSFIDVLRGVTESRIREQTDAKTDENILLESLNEIGFVRKTKLPSDLDKNTNSPSSTYPATNLKEKLEAYIALIPTLNNGYFQRNIEKKATSLKTSIWDLSPDEQTRLLKLLNRKETEKMETTVEDEFAKDTPKKNVRFDPKGITRIVYNEGGSEEDTNMLEEQG